MQHGCYSKHFFLKPRLFKKAAWPYRIQHRLYTDMVLREILFWKYLYKYSKSGSSINLFLIYLEASLFDKICNKCRGLGNLLSWNAACPVLACQMAACRWHSAASFAIRNACSVVLFWKGQGNLICRKLKEFPPLAWHRKTDYQVRSRTIGILWGYKDCLQVSKKLIHSRLGSQYLVLSFSEEVTN